MNFLLLCLSLIACFHLTVANSDGLQIPKGCEEAVKAFKKAAKASEECMKNPEKCKEYYQDLVETMLALKKCLAEEKVISGDNRKCETETGALESSQKAYGECVLGFEQCNEVYQEMIKTSVALEKCMFGEQENVQMSKACEEAAKDLEKTVKALDMCQHNPAECKNFYKVLLDTMFAFKKCLMEKKEIASDEKELEIEPETPEVEENEIFESGSEMEGVQISKQCEDALISMEKLVVAAAKCQHDRKDCDAYLEALVETIYAVKKCLMGKEKEQIEISAEPNGVNPAHCIKAIKALARARKELQKCVRSHRNCKSLYKAVERAMAEVKKCMHHLEDIRYSLEKKDTPESLSSSESKDLQISEACKEAEKAMDKVQKTAAACGHDDAKCAELYRAIVEAVVALKKCVMEQGNEDLEMAQ